MWKVLLLVACVAGSAISCDDSSNTNDGSGSESVDAGSSDINSSGCGGDPNAKAGCGYNCGSMCSDLTSKIKNISLLCPRIQCTPDKCDCKDGYLYDGNLKICVLPEQCTPICGLNEQYSSCINGGCGHRNCSQVGTPEICIKRTPESCIKGCICSDGFLRAENGTCVPQDQCPGTGCGGDPNAKPGCGYNCGNKCSNYKSKFKSLLCPRIPCKPDKCDCKPGYVFDDNLKICVRPEQCTPVCQFNEQYSSCTNGGCGHRNCSQVGTPEICIDRTPESCIKGCICSDGFLRAENGTCIPQDKCPTAGCGGDPNAHSGCGVNCGKTCVKNSVCPKICKVGGCDCNDGFLYDGNVNKCVLPNECTPICGVNEQYNSCTNGGCGHQNCSQIGQPEICIDPLPESCIKGCTCVEGYLRADNGTCIPQDQCPTGCGGDPNAHSGCGVNCGRTCSTYNSKGPIACPAICRVGGCDCNEEYVYDDIVGKCVLPEDCTPTSSEQCTGQNEYFDTCISGCSNQTCDTIGKIYNCPFEPAVCRTGCRCKTGFYRNADNVCVAESECPSSSNQCTGQNEYFDTCISGCSNQTCESIGQTYNCPAEPAVCRTGCRCQNGFYRNASNICVSESQCPTPACPEDEYWTRCPTVPCEGDNCPKDRNSPQTCPTGIVCSPPRCTCGFLDKRDKNGKCIKAYTCPPFKCDGLNEHYDSCPAGCPGEKCSDYLSGSKCSPFRIGVVVPCRPACKCNKGYYRNSNNICIKADQCGPVNTTTNKPVSYGTTPSATAATADSSTGSSNDGDGVANLQTGITNFNGEFLYDLMKAHPGQNLIASPYSVFTPLVQLALYADGDSLKQLLSVLNVDTKEQIRSAYPALVSSFEGQTSVNFSTAGKIYSSAKYPLSDAFIKDSTDIVHAEAQDLDFSKNVEAASIINSWVASKTNDRIHDLIQASDLSSLTRIVLVNAIYFKGEWHYAFDKKSTIKDADFYLSDGSTKKTQLMYQEGKFKYGAVQELDCTVLEMFYKGDNFSMVVVLPNKNDGVLALAEKLQDQANFDKVIGSMSNQKVQVYIPPFTITTTTDLTDILEQIGVTDIFDQSKSGLSGMLKTPEDTYVSKAVQKAFIEVNEEGSEAAAANGVIITTRSMPAPPPLEFVFKADRPFLFYIRLKGVTMFSGLKADI